MLSLFQIASAASVWLKYANDQGRGLSPSEWQCSKMTFCYSASVKLTLIAYIHGSRNPAENRNGAKAYKWNTFCSSFWASFEARNTVHPLAAWQCSKNDLWLIWFAKNKSLWQHAYWSSAYWGGSPAKNGNEAKASKSFRYREGIQTHHFIPVWSWCTRWVATALADWPWWRLFRMGTIRVSSMAMEWPHLLLTREIYNWKLPTSFLYFIMKQIYGK